MNVNEKTRFETPTGQSYGDKPAGAAASKDKSASASKPTDFSQASGDTGDKSIAEELASLKETVAGLVSSMGNTAANTFRDAADQVSSAASATAEAGANAANYAGEQAKTLANDLESFARRNPLGAMGGALAVGVVIGILGRGRH